jgi:hypothetical protein
LFPNHFFLVVGWKAEELDGQAALEHYRQRGTFEDRLGEFQQAIRPRLSHDEFAANEALLRLSLLAFNLTSMLRLEYEDAAGSCFDLGRFQRDVLKAGGRVVQQTRRLVLRVARVVTPFWRQLVDRLATLVAAKPPRDPDRPAPARVDAAATPRLPPRGPPRVTPPALSRHLHTQHRARRTTQGKGATAHQPRPFAARNKHTLNS